VIEIIKPGCDTGNFALALEGGLGHLQGLDDCFTKTGKTAPG